MLLFVCYITVVEEVNNSFCENFIIVKGVSHSHIKGEKGF